MKTTFSLAAVLMLVSCASAPAGPPPDRLNAVEKQLLDAKQVSLRFSTRTTGAVESHYSGAMNVLQGNIASIDADGEMAKKPSTIRYSTNGTPAHVTDALLLTLVRMGLTHDLYELSEGHLPSFIETGAEQHLKMSQVEWNAKEKKFTYHLVVEGADVGEGELWVGRHDYPVRRKLTVHFPNGDMKVDERYEWR